MYKGVNTLHLRASDLHKDDGNHCDLELNCNINIADKERKKECEFILSVARPNKDDSFQLYGTCY